MDIAAAARFFDVADLLDRPVGHLSGGEKSRVALARALVSRRSLYWMSPSRRWTGPAAAPSLPVLLQMHRAHHLPMLVVTHNIDDAAAMASHLVALKDGAVVAEGGFTAASQEPAFQSMLDARDTGAAIQPHGCAPPRHSMRCGRADGTCWRGSRRAPSRRAMCCPARYAPFYRESETSRLVELATEAVTLLSRVTAEAAHELDLAPGVAGRGQGHAFL